MPVIDQLFDDFLKDKIDLVAGLTLTVNKHTKKSPRFNNTVTINGKEYIKSSDNKLVIPVDKLSTARKPGTKGSKKVARNIFT